VQGLDFLTLLAIAVGLSADCFAVALGGSIAMRSLSFIPVLRVSLSFGLFQTLMPVLGWVLGRTVVDFIAAYDHWVAFALLVFVGGRMLWSSFQSEESRPAGTDISKGLLLLTLSLATSMDALAVGLSFAFLKVNIALASAIIGVVAFTITALGFLVGRKVSSLFGRWAEVIGGVILIGIGLRIILTHIL